MVLESQKGMVQTVLGTIQPSELGPTMTHEHLLINFGVMFNPPSEATTQRLAHEPVTLENLGWIRQYCYSNLDNLLVLDEDTAVNEALLYRRHGGGTIVDATTIGIGRDPLALTRISRASGVNVVMGAGYYVDAAQPDEVADMPEEHIAKQIVAEIQTGVGNTGVKAGIIGEIGCSWPLTPNEKKVLRASATAQRKTGAPILIHPGRNPKAPKEILEILSDAGAETERVIMGHLDRTITDYNLLTRIAETGCYLEYDLFGLESSHYPLDDDIDMPSDAQRMDFIKRLVDDGFGDRVVVAHDICTKHRLVKYGGHGWAHILEHIGPGLIRKGLSEKEVNNILIENPSRILTFS